MVMGVTLAMFEFITLMVIYGNRLDRILMVKQQMIIQARSVSLSADGTTVAIGARYGNDGNGE